MTYYSKSLEDYIRIPILLRNITQISQKSAQKLSKLLYYKYYQLNIDQRYIRQASNPNTDILKSRQNLTQKLYFISEDFNNDWPEFQVNYKAKFAIGVIDELSEEKQIQQYLHKLKSQTNSKLIGVINMGTSKLENLYQKENIIKIPDLNQQQFLHFIQPWLYNCLSLIESEICNIIAQLRKDDESNRTIVFNRLQEKFDQKIMKKKKKYRCIKLCGDYHLMLHLYQEAFNYYNEAQQMLKKIDDYLWILGCLQGKLACVIISPEINLSNREEYIEQLINQTYSVSKKTKNWNFQCQNYFKIAKLHIDQPEKIDQLMRSFLINYGRNISEDQKFLLFTTIGNLYEKCGFLRKRNYFYFLAATIHLNKKTQVSSILLLQIQKARSVKQWPYLYKKVIQHIIQQQSITNDNELYLELLSKCAQNLSKKQIDSILSELNFSNNQIVHLQNLQFLELKEFYAIQSQIKPKQNRIGNRESPRKIGAGFFMSWKRDQNLLFQENQQILTKGSIYNKIAFPIRVKISFKIHSFSDKPTICSQQQVCLYLQPSTVHKFQTKIKAKGATQQLWVIDQIKLSMWNFESEIKLLSPIKYEIYQKQPQIQLNLQKQLIFEQSCNLFLQSQIKIKNYSIPFSLIKLNVSIYYTIDVGFQQNQIILRDSEDFMGIDFKNCKNLRIHQSKTNQIVDYQVQDGVLIVGLKKFKTHRRNIARIEFTLQYIRSLNTKFQISKQYVRKCNFYSKFSYKIEDITTPIIDSINKDGIKDSRIIQNQYKLRLKIIKTNTNNLKSYNLIYNNVKYHLANSKQITIDEIFQKFQFNTLQKQLKQILYWQCEGTKIKGQMQIVIPIKEIMIKSCKNVQLAIQESTIDNRQKLTVNYYISSMEDTSLSHYIILNPVDIQIDRMYAIRGKTKFELFGKTTSNKFQCIFGSKAKNSYQIGIIFNDGWIYWHKDLIHINKS